MRRTHTPDKPEFLVAAVIMLSSTFLLCGVPGTAWGNSASQSAHDRELSLLPDGSSNERLVSSVGARSWWSTSHQKYVRVIQGACHDPKSPAYRLIDQSIREFINSSANRRARETFNSVNKSGSDTDLPIQKEFDASIEGWCRGLTLSMNFSQEYQYCFVTEHEVASLGWHDGNSYEQQLRHNSDLLTSLEPTILNRCSRWMKEVYVAEPYSVSTNQAVVAAREAEQDRVRTHEAERARQQQIALVERVAVEMKRPFEEAAIAEHDQIIWERTASRRSDNRGATGKGFPDSNTLFNELNAELERRQLQISQHVPFTPPGKGEFETTAAHKERVDVLKAEHAKQVSAQRNIALEQWTSTRAEIFHEYLGEPAMEKLTYNADKEMFSVRIKTASAPYYVDAVVNVPLTSAPAVKPEIEGASIRLGFALVNGVLEPKVLLLHTRKDLWVTRISNSTQVSMRFGTESARAWATAKSVREHEAAGRRDAQAQREAQRQQKEAEARRAAYQHNGPFLSKGALVCTDAKSMIRAAAIQRANNHYVSLPGDCIIAQGDFTPVTDLQRMNGGLVRVVIKSNGIPIFSMERYLVH